MGFTYSGFRQVPHGSNGPHEHLGHRRYDTRISTRDCILSLSDYPDNRLYVPTEKLIDEVFERLVEITNIEPLRVFNDEEADSRLTYQIIKTILLQTQDRFVLADTTGRFWNMFSTNWFLYSELSRQHLVEIYKGIYRDSDTNSDSMGNSNGTNSSVNEGHNHNESSNDSKGNTTGKSDGLSKNITATLPQDPVNLKPTPDENTLKYADNLSTAGSHNTNENDSHNWGWSATDAQNSSSTKGVTNSNNTSSSHSVGMSSGVFNIMSQWVESRMDMTGGLYYEFKRAGMWSTFI